MRRKILPFILGGALSVAALGPVAAAPVAVGPFGSLIGVIVQLEDVLNDANVNVLNINISDSLNNVLQNAFQNANIEVLTNSLNNILQNADIDVEISRITIVGDSIVVNLLGGDTIVLG